MGRRSRLVLLCALALCIFARPALADIFTFKDENGVIHFTNIPSNAKRYKLLRKENAIPAPKLAAGGMSSLLPSEGLIQQYSPMIQRASIASGVEKALVHAVISAESGYNPLAFSRVGAIGIMQLMPETAKRYGVKNLLDPADNINGGVRYLKFLLGLFNGNIELAVAGYNAGEN